MLIRRTKRPKKIIVICNGPIAISKKYVCTWDDVYLFWTGKPGRKKFSLAPIICSKLDLESEIQLTLDCQKKFPEENWNEDLKYYQKIKQFLSSNEESFYIDESLSEFTTIYTNKEWINRDEADKMISALMKIKGFDNIKCKWLRPKMVIIPMSV